VFLPLSSETRGGGGRKKNGEEKKTKRHSPFPFNAQGGGKKGRGLLRRRENDSFATMLCKHRVRGGKRKGKMGGGRGGKGGGGEPLPTIPSQCNS